jgi:predicted RNA binding protein with dsRBD fold (UPF0201 family)
MSMKYWSMVGRSEDAGPALATTAQTLAARIRLLVAENPGNVVQVRAWTPIRATEDEARVRQALLALFPDAQVTREDDRITASASTVGHLRQRVWELRIIDAVRGKLLHGLAHDNRSLRLRLSKQAALAGKVSFPPTPHALGDLEVELRVESGDPWPDAERLAWWIAPETKDGEIVGPS